VTQYYTKINGTTLNYVKRASVSKSFKGMGGTAEMALSYKDGTEYNNIVYGQEVITYRTSDDLKLWGGVVLDKKLDDNKGSYYTVTCGDYIQLTKKILVDEVYRGQTITAILNDLCLKYLPAGFTYNNIGITTKTLEHIQFKRKYLYDCFMELSKYEDWVFFIDVDKDFNFKQIGATFSGQTFTKGDNLKYLSEKQDGSKLVNRVRIIGGFREFTKTELFSGDGSNDTFTLQYKPISVKVEVDFGAGFIEQKGYLKAGSSDWDYDIDAEAFQIIFDTGKEPPAGADNVRITYNYGVPVIIESEDSVSQTDYLLSEVDIYNETIYQKQEGIDLAKQTLTKYNNPLPIYDGIAKGIFPEIDVGETIRIIDPKKGIDGYYIITNLTYDLLGGPLKTKFTVTETQQAFVELMNGILKTLDDLKSNNKVSTDIITKLLNYNDSVSISDNDTDQLQIYKRSIAGETLIWGSPSYGIWGVGKWGQSISRVYGTKYAAYGGKYGSSVGSYIRVV